MALPGLRVDLKGQVGRPRRVTPHGLLVLRRQIGEGEHARAVEAPLRGLDGRLVVIRPRRKPEAATHNGGIEAALVHNSGDNPGRFPSGRIRGHIDRVGAGRRVLRPRHLETHVPKPIPRSRLYAERHIKRVGRHPIHHRPDRVAAYRGVSLVLQKGQDAPALFEEHRLPVALLLHPHTQCILQRDGPGLKDRLLDEAPLLSGPQRIKPRVLDPPKIGGRSWFDFEDHPHPIVFLSGLDPVRHRGVLKSALAVEQLQALGVAPHRGRVDVGGWLAP